MMVREPTRSYNERLTAQGQAPFEALAGGRQWWKRRRIVADYGECWERTSLYKECGSTSLLKERKRKKFLKDAEKEKQEGIQGQWQQESLAKEFLDQEKSSADTDCLPRNDEVWIPCNRRRRLEGIQKNLQS